MAASSRKRKPSPMTENNSKNKLYNKLLDAIPGGWSDNSYSSGKAFLDITWNLLWKVCWIINMIRSVYYGFFIVNIIGIDTI